MYSRCIVSVPGGYVAFIYFIPDQAFCPVTTDKVVPMFKASIDIDLLRDSIAALSVIVEEVRLRITPEGISVKAVDAANVAMVIFDLKSGAFESYEASETEIGLSLEKLNDILAIVDKKTVASLELDEESQKLLIDLGGFKYTLSLIELSTIRTEPRIPQLDLPARVTLSGQEFRTAIKAAEKISDHITLGVSGNTFFMEAKEDTDSVRLEMDSSQLIDLKSGDACSLFSLDYLTNISKPSGKSSEVSLSLGRDFPILIYFETAAGAGTVTYLLAPRIESD